MIKTVDLISPTTLARKIMYRFGKSRVFTNNYDSCRTVKCYLHRTDREHDTKLANELYLFLRDAGQTGHSVGFTRSAMIIRIPK